jgi:hypothetical protein
MRFPEVSLFFSEITFKYLKLLLFCASHVAALTTSCPLFRLSDLRGRLYSIVGLNIVRTQDYSELFMPSSSSSTLYEWKRIIFCYCCKVLYFPRLLNIYI